ncbi:NAD(P)/FAD-dependent oxidoreductase, partial [Candidatus Parcubacteria bacterium]|nr:NAD(P)/FAD-dependent oxidoreductase [Candidatus Parcubacteria bacterium]
MYNIIIIGSGPAGMTAGIYAARREMKALIIGKELGGQM